IAPTPFEDDFIFEEGECPPEMCWAECVDDWDTDGICFERTVFPLSCPVGVCCFSVEVPCAIGDGDGDGLDVPEGDVDDLEPGPTPIHDDDWDFDVPEPDEGDGDFDPIFEDDFDFDDEFDFESDSETCPPELCKASCVSELVDHDGDGVCWSRITLPFTCAVGICCFEEQVPCGEPQPRDTCTEYRFNLSWGSLGSGLGQFSWPQGVVKTSSGFVYVADYVNDRVQKFTGDGVFVKEVTYPGFSKPGEIAVGSGGSYFVVGIMDFGGGMIELAVIEFNGSDEYARIIIDFVNPFDSPVDVAASIDRVYVADSGSKKIFIFELVEDSWVFEKKWGTDISGDAIPSDPKAVSIDSKGKVYVADYANHKIKKFHEDGTLSRWWGGSGVFANPWDVFVDEFDFVYVADSGNNQIQKYDSDGTFITKFGSMGSGAGEFRYPSSVFEDGFGSVYVADTQNNRIQLWSCNHSLCSQYDALLDVGNDSALPWEWESLGREYASDRVWVNPENVTGKINAILRAGCLSGECIDCVVDGEECLIPFSFRTADPVYPALVMFGGGLFVEDINFSYWIVDTVADVPYGSRFRFSEGGNWTVRFEVDELQYGNVTGNVTYLIPLYADCRDLCFDITYLPYHPPGAPPDNPLDAHDAVDDAMYRLLDQKLDVDPKDGVIEKLDLDRDGTK
ncbi:hypothetical protein KKC44_06820, partial [Patescibacteria group bacterium]|nr:hypothetical protein [Patescibacteria group bacterium]